jgi:hypothetical protein
MTPIQTALDLYKKFYDAQPSGELETVKHKTAIKCALIAVDEIIFQYTTLNSDLVNWIYKTDKVVYWQQVRKEIELL